MNTAAEITFDFQKLKLSFKPLRKNPRNKISSEIGETTTPARIISQSLWKSIAAIVFPESAASTTITTLSHAVTTRVAIINPRRSTRVVSFVYLNGGRRQTHNVINAGNTQSVSLIALE